METEIALTVGAVARLAGVTVRTLHHYDEIGLVSPAEHTDAGYRLYSRRDIERLQEVLFFRELGIGLTEIRRIVEEPEYRRVEALGSQRELLLSRSSRLLAMVEAIDRAINAQRKGIDIDRCDSPASYRSHNTSRSDSDNRSIQHLHRDKSRSKCCVDPLKPRRIWAVSGKRRRPLIGAPRRVTLSGGQLHLLLCCRHE